MTTESSSSFPTTTESTTPVPTTTESTTAAPTTSESTTIVPSTTESTSAVPTTSESTTAAQTTTESTTAVPTTPEFTTPVPTTTELTTAAQTSESTTPFPTTTESTTSVPTTIDSTTLVSTATKSTTFPTTDSTTTYSMELTSKLLTSTVTIRSSTATSLMSSIFPSTSTTSSHNMLTTNTSTASTTINSSTSPSSSITSLSLKLSAESTSIRPTSITTAKNLSTTDRFSIYTTSNIPSSPTSQKYSLARSTFFETSSIPNTISFLATSSKSIMSTGFTLVPTTRAITTRLTTAKATTIPSTIRYQARSELFMRYGYSEGDSTGYFWDMNDGYFEVYLPEYFLFGTKYHKRVYVNVNGFISFDNPVIAVQPYSSDPLRWISSSAVIAPFWADIDLNNYGPYTNPGRIFHRCISRKTKYSYGNDQVAFDDVQRKIIQYIDYTATFTPTMICTFTWSNVSPYPFGRNTQNEVATFQLVLTSDNSNGRSYAIFSYEYLGWNYRINAQGYKMDNSLSYLGDKYKYYFRTSGSASAFELPFLIGPKGKPGQWFFQLSLPQAEVQHQSAFKCYAWYDQQMPSYNYYYWYEWGRPECPCNLWQALIDPNYGFYTYQSYSNLVCFIVNFPQYPTSAQKCCYYYTSFYWTWWWWWWSPWFFMSSSWLDTSRTYDSGSLLRYHPYYYPYMNYIEDVLPKQWCCLESNNCELFYEVRPKNYCWGYRPPFFAFLFGDPHITTLDGLSYTFNGWGEYWMIYSPVLKVQARTSPYITPEGTFGNATVFTGFAFKDYTENFTSPRMCVVLAQDQTTMVIKDDNGDSDAITKWFYSSESSNGTKYPLIQTTTIMANDSALIMKFPSGVQATVEIVEKSLKLTLNVPASAKDFEPKFEGLYGVFDGKTTNDLTFRNRTVIPTNSSEKQIFEFGQSWAVSKAEDSLFWYNMSNNETFEMYQHKEFVPIFSDDLDGSCKVDKTEAVKSCSSNSSTDSSCVYDYCVTGSKTFADATKATSQEIQDTQKSLKDNYVPLIIVPLNYQAFTVNIATNISISINSTEHKFNLRVESSPSLETKLNCLDQYCHQWELQAKPKTSEEFNLTLYGNDTNGKEAKPSTISILMCDCSGRGTCLWNQTINTNNTDFKRVECLCLRGVYSGDRCQDVVDYCTNAPCSLNRSCSSLNESELISLIDSTNGSSNLNLTRPFKGYVCADCPNGSAKDSMDRCIDVDECVNSSTPVCNVTKEFCRNLEFSYECICKAGFTRSSLKAPCEDVDECSLGTDNCEQICTNTEGLFNCSCVEGYTLQPNNSCLKTSNCSVASNCDFCTTNSSCLCKPGYNVSQNGCIDIDECDPQPPSTPPCNQTTSICVNKNGSYSCDCKIGYYRKEGFSFCQPCESGFYGIDCIQKCNCLSQNCFHVNGCLKCDSSGWKIPLCTEDIDECFANNTICGNGNCTNTNGSYICSCETWFTFSSGVRCEILDACMYDSGGNLRSNPPCQNGGSCSNGTDTSKPGSFDCTCLEGFTGKTCKTDIDECLSSPCLYGGTCTDKVNGYDCKCPKGYGGPRCEYVSQVEQQSTASTNFTALAYTDAVTTNPSSSQFKTPSIQSTTVRTGTAVTNPSSSPGSILTQSTTAGPRFSSATPSNATTSPVNTTVELAPAVITAIIFPIVFSSLTCASFSIIFGLNFLRGFFIKLP